MRYGASSALNQLAPLEMIREVGDDILPAKKAGELVIRLASLGASRSFQTSRRSFKLASHVSTT